MSIDAVYTEGEKQLKADEEFMERHIEVSEYSIEDELHAGIALEEGKYIEEYINRCNEEKFAMSMSSTKVEMATVEKLELERRMRAEQDREKLIISTCEEYVGKIRYNFGMKPTYEGWTIEQGLDCSGFVEFIYMQCGIETEECIESTLITYLECKEITHDELKVGYLGMVDTGGSYYTNSAGEVNYTGDFNGDGEVDEDARLKSNHVGIYLGQDENGNDLWCHCNARDNNVVIGNFPSFKYYYSVTIKGEEQYE